MSTSTNTATNTTTNTATNTTTNNNTNYEHDEIIEEFEKDYQKSKRKWLPKHYENRNKRLYFKYRDDFNHFIKNKLELLEFMERHNKLLKESGEQQDQIDKLKYKCYKLRVKKEGLEDEIDELRNSKTSNEEARALRQTIRRQMQTIASLQLQLNQHKINRDSFNPTEDTQE